VQVDPVGEPREQLDQVWRIAVQAQRPSPLRSMSCGDPTDSTHRNVVVSRASAGK
jgi:hypothetical protein